MAAEQEGAFLLAFRAAHPALRRRTWHDAASLRWLGTDGLSLPAQYFSDPGAHFLAWRIAEPSGSLYVAYNGAPGDLVVTLPPPAAGRQYRAADTATWLEPQSTTRPAPNTA
jgi:pullulanase/glycogen debranching enzyme